MDDYVPTSQIAAGLECIIVSVMVVLQFLAILWLLIVDLFQKARDFARRITRRK